MTWLPQVSNFKLFLGELGNYVRACHMHVQYLHSPMWQQSCLKGVSSVCFCACLGLTQERCYCETNYEKDNSVNTFHWLTELVRLIMLYFFQYFSSMPTEYFVNHEQLSILLIMKMFWARTKLQLSLRAKWSSVLLNCKLRHINWVKQLSAKFVKLCWKDWAGWICNHLDLRLSEDIPCDFSSAKMTPSPFCDNS